MLNTSSTGGLLEPGEATAIAPEARPFTERTEYQKDFTWIRTALQYTAELLKDITAVLAIVYFLGVVAICVAILFYTLSR